VLVLTQNRQDKVIHVIVDTQKELSNKTYIAHVRATDQHIQTVAKHLLEVADIAKALAAKINVPEAGELIGLLHDFWKYIINTQNKTVSWSN